jgi:hypothetical protein
LNDGTLQVAVSNPFDTAMLNSVQFDAKGPVRFALATKVDIEKALKKYYGVGAETLDVSSVEPRSVRRVLSSLNDRRRSAAL